MVLYWRSKHLLKPKHPKNVFSGNIINEYNQESYYYSESQ